MKRITTQIIKYNAEGLKATAFKRSIDELPMFIAHVVRDKADYRGSLDEHGVRHWVMDNFHLMVDNEAYRRDDGTDIHFGIVIFPTPVEQALATMGIVTVPSTPSLNQLCIELKDTYVALGITDWLKQGMPAGIRSVVAYRYGYTLNAEFNNTIDIAMKMLDAELAELKASKLN